MSSSDRAVTVFSPDGQLLQVQHAQEAARRASAGAGVRGARTVALAVERRTLTELQEVRTERKIVKLDDHVMLAYAGLRADARVMISRCQIECQSHRLTVEDPVSVEYIARYIAEMKQRYTQSNGRRPFGIACLLAGFDYDGSPHLFQTDPSGIYYEWKAAAIGRYDKAVREYLEQNYKPEAIETEEGVVRLAIGALLEVQGGPRDLDVVVMKHDQSPRVFKQEEIKAFIREIEKAKEEARKKKNQ